MVRALRFMTRKFVKRSIFFCKILTKFRISDHKLEIGRYKKVPRDQRICKACKVLDDEKHFFLHCHINYNIRNSLIQEIENYYD